VGIPSLRRHFEIVLESDLHQPNHCNSERISTHIGTSTVFLICVLTEIRLTSEFERSATAPMVASLIASTGWTSLEVTILMAIPLIIVLFGERLSSHQCLVLTHEAQLGMEQGRIHGSNGEPSAIRVDGERIRPVRGSI
jgi:hypothetical protein